MLTIVAALAAAFLVGGAFTRMVWPLGAAIGVWLVASVVLSGLYPEAIQRFTVIAPAFPVSLKFKDSLAYDAESPQLVL